MRTSSLLVLASCVGPSLAGSTCCFAKWGDVSTCGSYTGPGGKCNTDPTKSCILNSDCPATPVPTPTPGPSPTPPSPHPAGGYPTDKIRFYGRWFSGDGIATTNWGNSFMVKFKGSRTVGVSLSTVSSNDGGSEYFVASIDGGELRRLAHSDQKSTLMLPFNLDPGKEHTLVFGRSDEASYGKTTLHDIVLDQGYTALALPAPKGLRLEVLGDSITAGFKVTGAPATSTEDVFKTYEYLLKEHWGVEDWSVIARSGIGVTDGWGQRPMIEQYVCSSFEFSGCPKKWDFSKWSADVVAINLGTNDFTFGTPSEAQFEKGYSDLLALVRSNYPQATIFCIVPIIYSCFPTLPKWGTMRTAIQNVVNKADSKVHFIPTGNATHPWLNCGSDFSDWTHPTVEGHKKYATRLQVELDPLLPKNDMIVI